MPVAKRRLIVTTAAALALSVATQAAGSEATQPAANKAESGAAHGDRPRLAVLAKPSRHFHKSVRIAHRRAERAKAPGGEGLERHAGRVPFPGVSRGLAGTLDSIAACESGGDPSAVSPDGTYRGKYQFDYGTWASVGGSGDPAAAPEAEQDYRAAASLQPRRLEPLADLRILSGAESVEARPSAGASRLGRDADVSSGPERIRAHSRRTPDARRARCAGTTIRGRCVGAGSPAAPRSRWESWPSSG